MMNQFEEISSDRCNESSDEISRKINNDVYCSAIIEILSAWSSDQATQKRPHVARRLSMTDLKYQVIMLVHTRVWLVEEYLETEDGVVSQIYRSESHREEVPKLFCLLDPLPWFSVLGRPLLT
ncbi:hypothetical protein TNCV_666101 [Trichonephila clavipes]|uniref:Uncharacterized protein n=1 Tax=Trichonephila clavipes TaxID=2585209 RepID=A0A8X6SPV8_TRICX|nr:hypothetical protein TNCV_666101 [Trichonephila clavipes]